MNLIYFIVFSLLVFLSAILGGKKYRTTTLYALAIGGVVNANFFHAGNYPIMIFNFPFGIDSIIYTLFIFCVIIMFIQEGKDKAYLLSFSSIVAIMFSALMQLIAELLSKGSSITTWNTFLTFLASSIASVIAIVIMLEILDKIRIKSKNNYLLMFIGIILATVINTCIYFPASTLINGTPANILILIATSFIGKLIALLSALFTLFLINLYDKKVENKNIDK